MLRLGMTNPPYILEHLEVRKKRESFICRHRHSLSESAWNLVYSAFHFKLWLEKIMDFK